MVNPLKIGLFVQTQCYRHHCILPFTFYFFPLESCCAVWWVFPTHVHTFSLSPYPVSYTPLIFTYESFKILPIPEITLTFPPLFEIVVAFLLNELTIAHPNLHNYSWLLSNYQYFLVFFSPCSSSLLFVEGGEVGGSSLSERRHMAVRAHLFNINYLLGIGSF